jgi:hypothetical protein
MKTAHIFGIEAGIIVEQWEIAEFSNAVAVNAPPTAV